MHLGVIDLVNFLYKRANSRAALLADHQGAYIIFELLADGGTVMLKKLSTIPILTFFMLNQAIAQQAQPSATPQPPPGYWPGPWHMWGNGWPHWWMGPMIDDGSFRHLLHRDDRALDLLKERFARGEINQAEYEAVAPMPMHHSAAHHQRHYSLGF